jgi:hypothetical protein
MDRRHDEEEVQGSGVERGGGGGVVNRDDLVRSRWVGWVR